MIDEAYLVQGHTLKKGPDDSLIFFSLGYANEIPLPNAGYHLYNCRSLTIPLVPQEESRCWYFLTLTEKSASARKYRCSTSSVSIQGIVFSMRNGGVTVFELVHPGEQEV